MDDQQALAHAAGDSVAHWNTRFLVDQNRVVATTAFGESESATWTGGAGEITPVIGPGVLSKAIDIWMQLPPPESASDESRDFMRNLYAFGYLGSDRDQCAVWTLPDGTRGSAQAKVFDSGSSRLAICHIPALGDFGSLSIAYTDLWHLGANANLVGIWGLGVDLPHRVALEMAQDPLIDEAPHLNRAPVPITVTLVMLTDAKMLDSDAPLVTSLGDIERTYALRPGASAIFQFQTSGFEAGAEVVTQALWIVAGIGLGYVPYSVAQLAGGLRARSGRSQARRD